MGYLNKTLESLRSQTYAMSQWELVVVDNGSSEPLINLIDISWHPNARLVREEKLGLAHARKRGYNNSVGQLIVHSDDDNILDERYLENAYKIYCDYPHIGTFGGQLIPLFDVIPEKPHQREFQSRLFGVDMWSNIHDDNRTMPFGAGMCLRREVVDSYLEACENDPRRLMMGRAGNGLLTGEDIDINWQAVVIGLGTGLFCKLKLQHLTPAAKVTDQHILHYTAGNAYSMVVLRFLHFNEIRISKRSFFGSANYFARLWLRLKQFDRQLELAQVNARERAIKDMRKWGWLDS
jgi:glycosyltransferase involved in cell wall biosynthesis